MVTLIIFLTKQNSFSQKPMAHPPISAFGGKGRYSKGRITAD